MEPIVLATTIKLVIGIILGVAAIYFAIVATEAKLEVESSPREPMYECEKHGVFRKSALVTFLDTEWCPFCVSDKIKMPLDSTVNFSTAHKYIQR